MMSKINSLREMLQRKFSKQPAKPECLSADIDGYLLGQLIGGAIAQKNPLLVSRLGWTEATCLGLYLAQGEKSDEGLRERIWRFSGVFPPTEDQFTDFAREYLGAIAASDALGILGSPYEKVLVEKYGKAPLLADLGSLEPYFSPEPWTQWLEGRRVVVVHPFAESIQSQYQNARERIFVNPKVLPAFDLRVVRAPQTIAGNSSDFASWNAALDHLRKEVAREDFDVAILGCGAYGLPLGATIKSLGKVCVHMGGSVQLLFGITGARWRDKAAFRALQTNAWISPLVSERPPNWQKVEDGCYW